MTGSTRSAIITVMERAVRKGTKGLLRDFGEIQHLQASRKGPDDFVTSADSRAATIVAAELTRARPEFGLLSKKHDEIHTDHAHWIVDALAGTQNFLHAIPRFAVSIALAQGNEIIAAMILDPILDELFFAEKGTGAYLNRHRLRVSSRRDMSTAVVAMSGSTKTARHEPSEASQSKNISPLDPPSMLQSKPASWRITGSAALDLAWLAAGRFDGFVGYGLSPWDIAAGTLLVSEAGGSMNSGTNKPVHLGPDLLAANGYLGPSLSMVGSFEKSKLTKNRLRL